MYEDVQKAARESKSSMFSDVISQLSREVFQVEELASRIVGRVTGANQTLTPAPPEPSPCPAMVMNRYPDSIREIRERLQKAREEIIEALF